MTEDPTVSKLRVGNPKASYDFDNFTFEADVNKLWSLCDPFYWGEPWGIGPFSAWDVRQYMYEGNSYSKPHEYYGWDRENHLRRCAWLAMYGWNDGIHLDVGVAGIDHIVEWAIVDGNHRFVASIVRGDKSITAIGSGDLDVLESLIYS